MDRRTSERASSASSSSADGSVNDEGALHDTWLCRSTVCASEDDDEDDNNTKTCGWSQLHTPTPFSLDLAQTRDKSEGGTKAAKEKGAASSGSQTRKGKRRLPLLSGFSNAEALRAQLPRVTSKHSQITRGDAAMIEKRLHKTESDVKRAVCTANSNEFTPSTDEIEANRRKWDLERQLQDADQGFNSLDTGSVGVPEQKRNLRRKLQNVNTVVPSSAEVEANRRKWDLERRLQDDDQAGVPADARNGPGRKRDLRQKLLILNPFAMKMNPVIPSAAEAEVNRRKWDLERRLQDDDRVGVSGSRSERNVDSMRKLPTLNHFTTKMNPVIPSVAEAEANRRKWDRERRLQDADPVNTTVLSVSVPQQKRDLRRKLQNLNPFAVNPGIPSAAEVEANRRKWDLERRLQDGDLSTVSVSEVNGSEQKCDFAWKLPSLNPASFPTSAMGTGRHNMGLESKLYKMEIGELELKFQVPGRTDVREQKDLEVFPSPNVVGNRQERHGFEISEQLVYLVLFCSTAVLHCAIFNFNLELRQFLRLDLYPFGVMLLLSWTFVGLIHFVGGLVGDLVRNRVRLLRRTAVLWGVAVISLHVAAFEFSAVASSMSLVLGLLGAGVSHGILCPNVIALRVEAKLCNFHALSTPLSPEDDEDSSSEEDSGAESESSNLSDVSTVISDEEQQGIDVASHYFFSGCFAARLAGSSLVQGYYFLLENVDTFSGEDSQSTATPRGFHCMVLMSFGLMASLIYFCFQSWGNGQSDHSPGDLSLREKAGDQRLENKIAVFEQGFTTSAGALGTRSWKKVVHLCNHALVGYALLAFVLMTLIGAGFSLSVVLLAFQTSLSVRLVAFLLIVIGWLLTVVASSRQLNPTKKQLLRECRRVGLRSRQLYLVIFAVAFICVSGCVSFLRAQLFTTMVVQVCQTRLLIPGTTNTLFNPDVVGTAVGISSLVLLSLTRVLSKSPPTAEHVSPNIDISTKANLFAPTVPLTPVLRKTQKQSLALRLVVSCPPVTRMCFAMLLYLISIFLSSVVELYRRKAEMSPSVLPRSCGSFHSEFTFLWTSPYVVLLGASDALFRVSLQEVCHELAQGSFASTKPPRYPRRWAGTVQGAIALAEALGYTTALSLVAMLSRWLFRPEPTDMALLFLLLTTVVALTHALLKRIAARAQAYQRFYFPARSQSTAS